MLGQFASFVDLLQFRADHQASKTVFTFLADGDIESDALTYAELDLRARAIASFLQIHQAQGERALLLYPPGLDFICAFLGCLYAKVVAVPAYPPRPNRSFERLHSIIQDAQAKFALTTAELKAKIANRLQELEGSDFRCLATDAAEDQNASAWQQTSPRSEDLAFLQYTSGSTGNPKGVIVSHGNLLHNSKLINQGFQDTEASRGISWLPPYHDMGLIGGILQPIYVGASQILMPPVSFLQRPFRWLRVISEHKITTSGAPNFAYDLCVSQITPEQKATLDLSSWRLAFTGAEPVRSLTLKKFAQAFASVGFRKEAFYPCYGMAETTLIVSGGSVPALPQEMTVSKAALEQDQAQPATEGEPSVTLVSSGQVIGNQLLRVVDVETGRICEDGEIGEIWVKGNSVAQGYWQNEDLTQATFQAQVANETGFLRTGDLGFLDRGDLYITGRLKDLLIIRGRNHYPQDLELTVEKSHVALRQGAGAAISLEIDGEEQLVIIQEVERRYVRRLDVEQVAQAIRRAIATEHQLQPQAIIFIKTGSIPKTSSGKIRRHACKAGLIEGSLSVIDRWDAHQADRFVGTIVNDSAPRASQTPQESADIPISIANKQQQDIEQWLKLNIARRLDTQPAALNIDDPFASYGLDSVQAVQLTAELEDWLHRKLEPTLAYDYPSIRALATFLVQGETPIQPLPASKTPKTSEIAIVGLSCRFPQAETPEAFWQMLITGQDGIRQLDDRWGTQEWGGFLDHIDRFDPQFFGISPREAEQMDPQQRLLLEVSWEALERAGMPADTLAGSTTGVFVGISNSDYAQLQVREQNPINAYMGTGNAHSIAANRLSYVLDLRGPSLSIDTACSSSLVAVHLACQSLLNGDCEQAIAAGVNLILTPDVTQAFAQAGMMSPEGRCKTFDAAADGYVRGEGCGVVILKPLDAAVRDGDNILAVIYGSAINQDGRSNGLTAPNGLSQQAVIRQAIAQAGITPADLECLEAHGTGTALGDPIEVNSIKSVLQSVAGEREHPCWLSSVKTNIGHLEAAAGIAGLIKVILSMQQEKIPQHLHFQQLNPRMRLEQLLDIPQTVQPWPRQPSRVRFAGVSSFGFGGTNAHVIVGDPPVAVTADVSPVQTRPWHLLTISAKSQMALAQMQRQYQDYLAVEPTIDSQDLCFSANTGRTHFSWRRAVVFQSLADLQSQLQLQDNEDALQINPQKLAFLFTGQGSQYHGMGLQLYQSNPLFQQTLDKCDRLWQQFSPDSPSLTELLYGSHDPQLVHETAYTQPLIFAVEYAIAQLWLSWGITPDFCMGHSVGEYVAACLAGVFSLEDGFKLITARGKLMQKLPNNGSMAAVFADKTVIKPYLSEHLTVGAENGSHLVLSGKTPSLEESITKLQRQGIKTKPLKVSHAFHSPLMEPMLDEFRQVAEQITYHLPRIPLISNVTGQAIAAEIASSDYWVRHVLQPVKFVQSIQSLSHFGVNVYLEIGAKPVLLSMGRHCLPHQQALWLPSLRPQGDDWQEILTSLKSLYEQGLTIDWQAVEQGYGRHKIPLPTYPFQRQRYWFSDQSWTTQTAPAEDYSAWYYAKAWQPLERLPTPNNDQKAWLILTDQQGIGQRIARQFCRSKLVYLGPANDFSGEQAWTVNLEGLIDLFAKLDMTDFAGIIHCWGLDADHQDLEHTQWLQCGTTLKLIQTLGQLSSKLRCWFITRQSQKVLAQDGVEGFVGSSLWGLGQTLALEHPELWGGIVDVDQSVPNMAELCQQTTFQHLAYRQGTLFAAQLIAHPLKEKDHRLSISPEGHYLITGGTGALGQKIAQWLVEQGAQHIVVSGRSLPPADTLKQWPDSITFKQCDLSNATQVKALIAALPKLKGIVHAAGTLEDGLIQHQTWTQFQNVMAAKVQGTWHLHRCSQDLDLDFFVMFSSVAALIGSPGQGNYAAANSAMDAIAFHRQALNLPALSINWGPWAGYGMAQALTHQAMEMITPDQGKAILGRLLNRQGQIGVFRPDWRQLAYQFADLTKSHYFASVLPTEAQFTTTSSSVFEQLTHLEVSQRADYVLDYLRQSVAKILKLNVTDIQPTDSLIDLGMDSLMVMEAIAKLKQDLQLMLYPREIYERPRLDVLTAYLATEFDKAHSSSATPTVAAPSLASLSLPSSQTWQQPETKNPEPIAFILSSPRSGSTLLRVMLAGHPQLYAPPELHLLPFETMGDRQTQLGLSHLGEGLQRALMDLDGLNAEQSHALVQAWVSENRTIAEVYAELQQKAANKLLIDKSPSYASDPHTLAHSDILFAQPKYIHLVRHPYAVIESFCRLRMDKLLGANTASPYALAESIWAESNQNILALSHKLKPEQYLQVVYEDLVRDPQSIMQRICEFLGVGFHPAVLAPYSGDRLTDGLHQQSMGVGDPNFLQRQNIDPSLADRWQTIKLPHRLQPRTTQLAQTFEYELHQDQSHTTRSLPVMVERTIKLRGMNLCLCEWGDRQQPLILLLHGILEQGASWQLIAPQLAAQGYWVVAPDLRGHGKSDHAQSYSMLDFLSDIDGLVAQITDQPFTLVGHSMGSIVAAMYAGIRPDKVRQLILVETIVPTEIDDQETANHLATHLNYLASPPQHPVFPDVAIAARRLRQAIPQLSSELAQTIAERSTVPCENGVQWRWDAFLRTRAGIEFNGISRRRYLALLQAIQAPITLIYGEQSEFNRPEDLDAQKMAMPAAKRLTVTGGHNLHFEAPEAIARIILQQLS